MKRIFPLIFLFFSITAFSFDGTKPNSVYKIAIESIGQTQDELDLRDYLRKQITSTHRGDVSLPIKNIQKYSFLFDKEGIATESTKSALKNFSQVDKLALVSYHQGYASITLIDVLGERIEYKNGLPDSLTKTLANDFFSFLDRKNIQLALQEPSSSTLAKVKLNSVKSKYEIGEPIRFEVETEEDNFLYVVVLSEDGSKEPVLLFPNSLQKNNFLRRGEKVSIPDIRITYKSQSTGSKEKLRVFASKEEWKDLRLGEKQNSLYQVLPQAFTGAKSTGVVPFSLAKTISETPSLDFQFEVSLN